MAILALPVHTELVEQRPVPVIVERFLDRRGSGWNLPSISTVLPASPAAAEEERPLEHMQLAHTAQRPLVAEVVMGGPLSFTSQPGDFDFDPGEE